VNLLQANSQSAVLSLQTGFSPLNSAVSLTTELSRLRASFVPAGALESATHNDTGYRSAATIGVEVDPTDLATLGFPGGTQLGTEGNQATIGTDFQTGLPVLGRQELVFIDAGVADYQTLLAGIKPGESAFLLDANQDGLAQISAVLAQYNNISAIHIVSHGSAGNLYLGNSGLNLDTLGNYTSLLQGWVKSLTSDADIFLYGCDVASGLEGAALVSEFAQLTQADIAASTNRTGSAAQGGDWDFEFTTGLIEAGLAFQSGLLATYSSTFAISYTGSVSSNSGITNVNGAGTSVITGNAILDVSGNITIDATGMAGNKANGLDNLTLKAGGKVTIFGTGGLGITQLGNLKIEAQTIELLSGAIVTADGDIEFSASETASTLTSLIPILGGISGNTKDAGITLGNNVSLSGANITLTAKAADVNPIDGITGAVGAGLVKTLVDYATDIGAAPISAMVRQSKANISIGDNSNLISQGDIEITASAEADATAKAISQLFSLGWSDATASAITTIGQGVVITAAEDITIGTDASATASMTTRTLANLSSSSINTSGIAVSLAIANSDLTAKTTINQNANITAGRNATIIANGKGQHEASAEAGAYNDGKAGISAGLSFSKADVQAIVNGKVTANTALQKPFNPVTAVNAGQDRITITNHTFKEGQAVVYSNGGGTDLGGLEDGTTYFVIVVDANTIKLAESASDAEEKKAIDLTTSGVTGTSHALKDVGIRVIAQLASEDKGDATSGVGGEPAIADNLKADVALDKLFQKLTADNATQNAGSGGSGAAPDFGAAGAVGFAKTDHTVEAKIGGTGVLQSKADVQIKAAIENKIQTSSEASSEVPEGASDQASRASVAVAVGLFSNTAKATVDDGATIDASKTIAITSEVSYPFLTTLEELFDFKTKFKEDGLTGLTDYLDGTLGFKSSLFNSWAKSTAKGENLGIAGSVNYLQFTNNSQATIGSGAKINQNPLFQNDAQAISVEATTELKLVNVTGVFDFEISLDKLNDLRTSKDRLADLNPAGSQSGKGGMGGSLFLLFNNSTTIAKVETGAIITTGKDGDLTINAESKNIDINLAQSGASGGQFAVGGTFSYTNQKSLTVAQLESGVTLTGGALNITANDETTRVNAVGGVAKGGNVGVGLSVSLNEMTRETYAFIGNQIGAPVTGSNIDVADINISAKGTGGLWSFSLAAAVVSKDPKKPENAPPQDPPAQESEVSDDPLDGLSLPALFGEPAPGGEPAPSKASNDQGNQGKSGVGISGDVSLNWATDKVSAFINDAGSIKGAKVGLDAQNDTVMRVASGSVAIASADPGKTSVGIAGSFSMNTLTGTTSAYINGTATAGQKLALIADQLSLNAVRSGDLFALSASGSGAAGKDGYAVAGSVSLNKITNTTGAYITGANSTVGGNVTLKAKDNSSIFAIGGAASFGGKAGVGAGIALNRIANTTQALVQDATLDYSGNLELSALNESSIKAITASIGVSTGAQGGAGAGTVSINLINNTTEAGITKTLKGVQVPTGAITLSAKNNADIAALAGAGGFSAGTAGLGAAVSYNSISGGTRAFINQSDLVTRGDITLQAENNSKIQALTLGVGGGKNLGFGGSVSINMISGDTEAYIASFAVLNANGKINVIAKNNSTIEAIAGGIAVSSKAAIGAAVSVNVITSNTTGYIDKSTVTSTAQEIALLAENTAKISAVTVGGAGAATFALGGSVSVNVISGSTQTYVSNLATLQANGKISIIAKNSGTIEALAGGVAVSNQAAIGAAVSTNNISSRTISYIDKSTVTSTANEIALIAQNTATISALTVGGAGSGQFALGGSVSTNLIGTTVDAHITQGSTITAAQNISLTATDLSTIKAYGGALAGAGTAAVAGALAVNELANQVKAYASASNLTSTLGTVAISADQKGTIEAISVGAAGGGKVGVAGSAIVNNLNNTTAAYITGSTVIADNNVVVLANSDNKISFYGGVLAVGGVAGVAGTAAINTPNNITRAYISGSSNVNAKGNGTTIVTKADGSNTTEAVRGVAVIATGKTEIDVYTGTAAAGFNAGVAGTASVNVVGDTTEAYIDGSTVNNTGANAAQGVVVRAFNETDINVVAGSLGVALKGAGVGATADVVVINNTTRSSIKNASVINANGNVDVTSYSKETVNSTIVSGGGALVGVAGSVGVITVGSTNEAYISGSTVNANGTLRVIADNNVNLNAIVGTGAAGFAGIGGSIAVSVLTNSTKAYITDSTTNARGITEVNANTIENVSTVSGSAGVGGVGVAGALIVNSIQTTTEASISETLGKQTQINQNPAFSVPTQTVKVNALNTSTLSEIAGAGGIGAVGIGASLAVGVIRNTTTAFLGAGVAVNAGGNVDVNATSNKTVDSKVAAFGGGATGIAGAVSVFNIGSGMSAEGAQASGSSTEGKINNEIGKSYVESGGSSSALQAAKTRADRKTTQLSVSSQLSGPVTSQSTVAYIGSGATVNAGNNINVLATDTLTLNTIVGSSAIGVGGLSVGGSVSVVNLANITRAFVESGATLNAVGNITVNAKLTETVKGQTFAGSAGSVGLGAQVMILNSTSSQTAYIGNGAQVTRANNLIVKADAKQTLTAEGLGGSIGGVALGAAIARATATGSTRAYIDANAQIGQLVGSQVNSVTVNANADISGNAKVLAIAAGIGAGTANDAQVVLKPTVDAGIGGSAKIKTTGDINLSATSKTNTSANVQGVALGGIAVGVSLVSADVAPTVLAHVDAGATLNAGNDLSVIATSNDTTDIQGKASAGALIGGSGVVVTSAVAPTVKATLGSSVTVTTGRDTNVTAQATVNSKADSQGIAGGVAGVGVSTARATTNPTVEASIGSTANIQATRNVNVSATANDTANASAKASAGALIGISGADSLASSASTVTASVGGTIKADNDISVTANGIGKSQAKAEGIILASGLSAGSSIADAKGNGRITAAINPSANLAAKRDINLKSSYNIDSNNNPIDDAIKADSNASAGAVVAGATGSKTKINSTATVITQVGANATLNADRDINLTSRASNDVNARALGKANGLVAGGSTDTDVVINTTADMLIGQNAKITAVNNLNVASDANSNVTAYAEGSAGQSIADAIGNLFTSGLGALFSGDGIPSLLTAGGSLTRVSVNNTANTDIGAGAVLIAGNVLTITADAKAVVDADSKMSAEGVVNANSITAVDVFVDSDALIRMRTGSVATAQITTLRAQDKIGVNTLARGEANASAVSAFGSAGSRVNIGSTSDPSEAKISFEADTKVIGVDKLTIEALNNQEGGNIVSRSEAQVYGTLTGTASTVADGTVEVRSIVESAPNSEMSSGEIRVKAESNYQLDRLPVSDASTVVTRVVESIRYVTRSITKWLPWPLDKIVEYVVDKVVDLVTVFDLSTNNSSAGGSGLRSGDTINLNGRIYNFGAKNKLLIVNADGSIDPSSNVAATVVGNDIVVGDIINDAKSRMSFLAAKGQVIGSAVLYLNKLIDEVKVINNSTKNLVFNRVDMISNPNPSEPDIDYDYTSGQDYKIDATIRESQLNITNNGNSDITFNQSISNVAAFFNIVNKGGAIKVGKAGVYLEAGDVGHMFLEAKNGIGTSTQRLGARLVRGKFMPGGMASEMPAEIIASASNGGIYLDVAGINVLSAPYTTQIADGITFNFTASGDIDVLVSKSQVIDNRGALLSAQGFYDLLNAVSINGNITIDVKAGDIILGDSMVYKNAYSDPKVGTVRSTNGTTTLKASGTIRDNNDAGAVDVTARSAVFQAGAGVGQVTNAIETAISNLEASAGTGGVWIDNTGNLVVGGLSSVVGLSGNLAILLNNRGSLRVQENVTSASTITLSVPDTSATGEDIVVTNNSTIKTTNGTVTLLAGDNIQIDQGSGIDATGNVMIGGDNGNADIGVGSTIDLRGTLKGTSVTVTGGSDNDIVSLTNVTAGAPVSIQTFAGDDLIHIGSNATPTTNTGGNLNSINAALTIDAGTGSDQLKADDSGDTLANTGTLTSSQLTGLGITGSFTYTGVETVEVGLGSGVDTFTIASTITGTTTVNAGAGADTINVQTIAGATNVNAGADDDTINVGNTSNTVDGIAAQLTIQGDAGNDVINVKDGDDTNDNTGNLTSTRISGLDMAGNIDYGSTETLNIDLGSGSDTFTIQSTHTGATNLNTNAGNDTVNVQTISGTTTVNTGANNDIVNVRNTTNSVNNIAANLTVQGGAGTDVLNVIDSGDIIDDVGNLTSTQISGLGMAGVINYSDQETLNIDLGTGSDTFTIQSTHTGVTNLNTNAGADIINVQTIAGATNVNAGAGDDTINVGDTNNTVDGIAAQLTIQGDAGNDVIYVKDTGDTNNNIGNLTSTQITGLDMAGAINYGTTELLDITLGSGGDTFTIQSTHANPTVLKSAAGADIINVQSITGATTVYAGADNDTVNIALTTPGGTLVVNGDAGNDALNATASTRGVVLNGDDGDDTIQGGAGNDLIGGGAGNDRIDGNAGNDEIFGDSTFSALATDAAYTGFTFGADVMTAPAGSRPRATQQAAQGNDTITGGSGSDTIYGEGGNDNLIGGSTTAGMGDASDYIFGGAGDDVIAGDNATINPTTRAITLLNDGNGDADYLFGDSGSLTFAADGSVTRATNGSVTGDGNDVIAGDVGNDVLLGGAGNDQITGNLGDDIILGDQGTIDFANGKVTQVTTTEPGVGGNDILEGNAGNDIILGGFGNDTISGNAGDDILLGDNGIVDYLIDGNAATLDLVTTTDSALGGSDTITGGDGQDVIIGGAGSDTLSGNTGDDILLGDNGKATFAAGILTQVETLDPGVGGNDTIAGNDGNDIAIGGFGDDTISGDAGRDVLLGDNGVIVRADGSPQANDIYSTDPTFGGKDTITGGLDNDIIVGGSGGSDALGLGGDTLSGNEGDDIIIGDNAYITRNAADVIELIETIFPSQGGDDVINGNDGNDIILGGFANDTIQGNLGSDTILGDNGKITMPAGVVTRIETTNPLHGGNDNIQGNEDTDIILGGTGDDTIAGNSGDDILLGDNGVVVRADGSSQSNDIFSTDPTNGGSDIITGGTGNDIIIGGSGNNDALGLGGDNLSGNEGDDIILGDNAYITRNALDVVEQIEVLFPDQGGDDIIAGNDGNDIILGGFANDAIQGNLGNDIIFGDNGKVTRANGVVTRIETTNPTNGGNDDIQGNEGSDVIFGGTGDDTIVGGTDTAADILFGDNGVVVRADGTPQANDIFSTDPLNAGKDTITGGLGNDIIIGGSGADRLTGNAGDDIIVGDNAYITRNAADVVELVETIFPDQGGNDVITGNDGNDILLGGAANDTMQGGLGSDVMIGDNGKVTMPGSVIARIETTSPTNGGNDNMQGNEGSDVILGGTGDDTIVGGTDTASDILLGDNGVVVRADGSPQANDIFSTDPLNGGKDTITGGLGNDIIIGGSGNTDAAGVGGDILDGNVGDDIIFGDNAYITRNTADVVEKIEAIFHAQGGDDQITGGVGNDRIFGGAGSDKITGDSGDDLILGDNGLLDYTIDGNIATLDLITTDQAGVAPTIGGNDVINGNEGNDIILGGAGNDTITGDAGKDIILGDNGKITQPGGVIRQIETTNPGIGGNDNLQGGDDDDRILGGFGNDSITGDRGNDILLGDNGILDYAGDTDLTTLDRIATTDPTLGGNDTIQGNDGNDIALGGAADDNIQGNGGDDVLLGDGGQISLRGGIVRLIETIDPGIGGNDTIAGNGGNDLIAGGFGGDTLRGDDGNDKILGDNGKFDFAYGGDAVVGADDNLATLDFVTTTDPLLGGADIIFGGYGDDQIMGGTGADTINGDGGGPVDPDWIIVAQGDFNGDGKTDILWRNTTDYKTRLWTMNGIAVADSFLLPTTTADWTIVGTADANGDGKQDIFWRNTVTGDLALWSMNGTANPDMAFLGTAIPLDWQIVGLGDFNGDGKADLLWRNNVVGVIGAWMLDGAVKLDTGIIANATSEWQIEQLADFNGDSRTDILWRSTATGQVGAWLLNGKTQLAAGLTANAPSSIPGSWQMAGIGDFNADGRGDVLWRNTVTKQVVVWLMDGNAVQAASLFDNVGSEWQIKGMGDFNGDGRADIMWQNQITKEVGAWLMNGQAIADSGIMGNGSDWQIRALGDFDGDRKIDLFWQSPTQDTGVWLVNGRFQAGAGLSLGELSSTNSNNDLILGDHGKIYQALPLDRNYFSIDIGANQGGGNDTIYGNQGDDIILGQQGDDFIDGGTGQDDIIGGHNIVGGADGNDTIYGGDDADVVLGDNGLITRRAIPGGWQTYPAPFNAIIRDIVRFDDIDRIGGNDTIYGGAGDDILMGQRGNDYIDGGAGDDEIYGQLGNDTLLGGDGQDTLLGDVGIITRDYNPDGTARINLNGSWHRDVILTDVGQLTSLSTGQTGSFQNPDLLLLTGAYNPDGSLIAGNTPAFEVTLFADGDDVLDGGAGDDALFGQRGNDILQGGTGNDYIEGGVGNDQISDQAGNDFIVGDDNRSLAAFNTELPIVTHGIHLIEANPTLNLNLGSYGTIVIPTLTMTTQATPTLLPTLTMMPNLIRDNSPAIPIGSLRGTNGTEFKPLISLVADTVNHLDLLAGNDVINAGAGQDTVIGDNYVSVTPIRTGNATIDQTFDLITRSLYQLNYDLHDLELALAGRSGAPAQELTIGSDTIDAGDDNDIVMGDNGLFLGPLGQQSPLNTSAVSALANDLRQIISNFSNTVNAALAPYVATGVSSQPYTLAIGNDTITGGNGDDQLLADDTFILSPILDSFNYVKGSFLNYALIGPDRSARSNFREFDLKLGNDTVNAGSGNDFVVGGYSNIITPIVTQAPQTANDTIQLQRSLDVLADDVKVFLRDLHTTNNGINYNNRNQANSLIAQNDVINGGAGDDLVFGDNVTLVLPIVNRQINVSLNLTKGNVDYGDESYNFGQVLPHQWDTIYRNPTVGFTRLAEDTITGGDGNDILFGERGIDTIWGDAGNDYLFGGADTDNLDGGAGTNFVRQTNPGTSDLTAIKPAIDAAMVNFLSPSLQRYLTEIEQARNTFSLEGQLSINF
jgi:Ca2+-binding RTX toxin-like protein/acetolactate synthase small subunit